MRRTTLPRNLGMILLAIWLIVWGVVQVAAIGSPIIYLLLALIAIAAGVLILLNR